jgi:uncharacterized protein YjbI with pentapeptide repeats
MGFRESLQAHAQSCREALTQGVDAPPYIKWIIYSPEGVDLSFLDLHQANLCGGDFHDSILNGSDLRGALLQGVVLTGSKLYGVRLDSADLHRAELTQANLSGASLRGVNLHGATLHEAVLRDANLQSANLEGANIYGADFRGASLKGAILSGVHLEHIDFRGAQLQGAQFSEGIVLDSLSGKDGGNCWFALLLESGGVFIQYGCDFASLEEWSLRDSSYGERYGFAQEHWNQGPARAIERGTFLKESLK